MGMVDVTGVTVETYRGGTYRLERREIASLIGRPRRVWCWEVLSGPGEGLFGGKQPNKVEARKTVRGVMKAYDDEAKAVRA